MLPEGLQEQRALAHPRLAGEQRDRSGHEAAVEHPIELGEPGGPGGRRVHAHVADRHRRVARRQARARRGRRRILHRACPMPRTRGSGRASAETRSRTRCSGGPFSGRQLASSLPGRYGRGVTAYRGRRARSAHGLAVARVDLEAAHRRARTASAAADEQHDDREHDQHHREDEQRERRVLTIEVDTSIGTLCPATPLIVVLEPSGKFTTTLTRPTPGARRAAIDRWR